MITARHQQTLERGLNIGVSIFVRKGNQSFWENGIYQNCVFLAMLLTRTPMIKSTYLVAGGGDGTLEDASTFLSDAPVPIINMTDAMQVLDVMIEMSAQLDREWAVGFSEKGGKLVSMRVGNDYVIDIERMIFDRPHGLLITAAPYTEIWTLPQYEHSCRSYFGSALRAPVRILPHLWSPLFLKRAVRELPNGYSFGYKPGRHHWRAGLFEPNICMVKTSFVPLLVCEVAHRANPEVLEHVWAYNTHHLKEHSGFNTFANNLDIVRHGIATFEGRFPFCQIMAENVDVVVSHHWENAQNYVYYEALFGGYPLIHNSHLIGKCGYRYEGFDCEDGGMALQRAFAQHDLVFDAYQRSAAAFLQTLAPDNDDNIRAYSDAIAELFKNA